VVLPMTMAPASRRRVTNGLSILDWKPLLMWLPDSVGKSVVQARSLMVTGRPCSGR
jgi:hypothetical protein